MSEELRVVLSDRSCACVQQIISRAYDIVAHESHALHMICRLTLCLLCRLPRLQHDQSCGLMPVTTFATLPLIHFPQHHRINCGPCISLVALVQHDLNSKIEQLVLCQCAQMWKQSSGQAMPPQHLPPSLVSASTEPATGAALPRC